MICRSSRPRPHARSRRTWSPTNSPGSVDTSGRASRRPSVRRVPPDGAPGCGWTPAPTAGPAFTATTARSSSPNSRAHRWPTACWTGSTNCVGRLARNCTSCSTTTAGATSCSPGRGRAARWRPPRSSRVTTKRYSAWGSERGWFRPPPSGRPTATRPGVYSGLIAEWARLDPGMTAWDLYGGAGVFAAVLADGVGDTGRVMTVDTSRGLGAGGQDRAGRPAVGRRGHRFGASSVDRSTAPSRRRRAGPTAYRRRPRGHRPVGRRRGAADRPHRL